MPDMTNFCSGNHILVGLGGTGGKILKAFKMRMFEEFPTAEERRKLPVQLLYVDSTREMMPVDGKARPDFRVMGQDASFTEDEFLNIKSVDVEHILGHISNYPTVRSIVDNVEAVRSAIGSLGQAAGQKRRAGRLLFAANATGYVNSLCNAYGRCEAVSGQAEHTYIYIFAGLAGGTGSGSIIDAIVQTRKRFSEAKIAVFAMIPEKNLPKADMDQGRYYENGYAALAELNALQTGRLDPQDVTGTGHIHLYNDRVKGVADGMFVYSNVNENGLSVNSLSELPKIVSDLVFARIFYVNEQDSINEDIIRAFNFENMDDFAIEFDEVAGPDANGKIPAARSKKVSSFGIKRVMYPELRILKHITYSVGESVLYQFKYNNWRENKGFVDVPRNRDLRRDFLNADNLSKWMLDDKHLTLDLKILESDPDYPSFNDYWHDKAVAYAEEAKKASCPLNELDSIMNDFFVSHFREEGVEAYFRDKDRAIPDMAKEVRRKVETELFEKWRNGDISIVELKKVSELLIVRMTEIRQELETKAKDEQDSYAACDEDRSINVAEWSRLGILQRMVGKGARLYGDHQNILTDYYVSKTLLLGWEFAKKLAAKVHNEISKMDADISAFGQKINDAIAETERLVTAQRKVNKGLEDMRSAIIEVSEDETMQVFEDELEADRVDMPNIARQIRETILPKEDFVNFGRLANSLYIEDITDAFDVKLKEIVKIKHDEKAVSEKKVLGLNILTQLQQKLQSDDDIKAFAYKIITQSGAYIKLNNDQMQMNLRNNEGNLSPTNPASINKKTILVSIPSPDDNEGLKRFADKLEDALMHSLNQGTARTTIRVNRKSLRKDELSVMTISYCYPLRAVDWLADYKGRYEQFLNTGNSATDKSNTILLHGEGDGTSLPRLFAVDNVEEYLKQQSAMQAAAMQQHVQQPMQQPAVSSPVAVPGMPPAPGASPMVPPIPNAQPEISLFIAVNGQQYGPFNYDQCKQMTTTGQLTALSQVWMQGMPAWTAAGQVSQLQTLFAPAVPQGMPPMPPTPGAVPPPMM